MAAREKYNPFNYAAVNVLNQEVQVRAMRLADIDQKQMAWVWPLNCSFIPDEVKVRLWVRPTPLSLTRVTDEGIQGLMTMASLYAVDPDEVSAVFSAMLPVYTTLHSGQNGGFLGMASSGANSMVEHNAWYNTSRSAVSGDYAFRIQDYTHPAYWDQARAFGGAGAATTQLQAFSAGQIVAEFKFIRYKSVGIA